MPLATPFEDAATIADPNAVKRPPTSCDACTSAARRSVPRDDGRRRVPLRCPRPAWYDIGLRRSRRFRISSPRCRLRRGAHESCAAGALEHARIAVALSPYLPAGRDTVYYLARAERRRRLRQHRAAPAGIGGGAACGYIAGLSGMEQRRPSCCLPSGGAAAAAPAWPATTATPRGRLRQATTQVVAPWPTARLRGDEGVHLREVAAVERSSRSSAAQLSELDPASRAQVMHPGPVNALLDSAEGQPAGASAAPVGSNRSPPSA